MDCNIDFNNYTCADKGLLLPLVSEYTWPIWCRALVYLLGLIWCFLGVAIVADIFMCSIEKITSHIRIIKVASDEEESGFEEVEVKVWNDTVANLTLMALGSSAPEILLACIEIVGQGFTAGDLGPGTIVGSAAFNLFCITAVCTIAIPTGEVRRISGIKVFAITSIFSLFAYIWLVIVLLLISPNVVELWEAFLTLAFFPILVVLAYMADKNCFCTKMEPNERDAGEDGETKQLGYSNKLTNFLPWNKKKKKKKTESGKIDEDRMRVLITELRAIHPSLSESDIIALATAKLSEEQPRDRLWYRINAVKQFGGNPKLNPHVSTKLEEVYCKLKRKEGKIVEEFVEDGSVNERVSSIHSPTTKKAIIELTSTQSAILEQDGKVQVGIRRFGNFGCQVKCRIETIDGSAEANKDYIPIKETITFEPEETLKQIEIVIIDDNEWEPDEVFFVKLSLDPDDTTTVLGKKTIQEITILNDDDPGTFEFEKPSFVLKESTGTAQVTVTRTNGADGKVSVQWKSEDMTAIEGRDYKGREGTIVFEHGEIKKFIEIPIIDDHEKEKDESFKLELVDTDCPGAKIGRIKKTIITVVDDDDFNTMVNRLMVSVNINMDALRVDTVTWSDQFRNAMNVNGGDIEGASAIDYVMHFLAFGWKLLFAFIPPPHIYNGWLSFFISLGVIGLLTAVVGDLASIFGCLVGLKDSVTSITFVALGTSLPDLFASKQAATMEKTADNSIGNVTGSNSVNVFLGLGLPWVLAAIYWTAKGKKFVVPAGSLGFSVVVFVVLAIIALVLLMVRRYVSCFGRAELGGPTNTKVATAILFAFFWLIYVLLSSLQAYEYISSSF